MDFKQRYIEGSSIVQLDIEIDRMLTNKYGEFKWDILDVLYHIDINTSQNEFVKLGFVVHLPKTELFFAAEIMYDSPIDIYVIDLQRISLDTFLEYIIHDKYIKYGV